MGASTRMVFVPCVAGTYSGALGASSNSTCVPCPAGTQSQTVKATSNSTCRPCLPGFVAPIEGRTECDFCPTGRFQNLAGSVGCVPCSNGTYASINGSAECNNCLAGVSSYDGSSSCDVCAEGYFRLNATTKATQKACDDSLCTHAGVSCPQNTTLETLVLLPGYWRLSSYSREITACAGGNAKARCAGGKRGSRAPGTRIRRLRRGLLTTVTSSTLEGDGYCGTEYSGPL